MLDVMFDADIADRADVNPAPQPLAGIAFANLGPHQCRWPLETPQERGPWPRGTPLLPRHASFGSVGSPRPSLRIMDALVQVIVENIAVRLTGKHPQFFFPA